MKQSKLHLILLILLASITFLANNSALPADYMESRNLATAQEMVATGNYLIPTMNGELRLEKPPLPTWIAAGIELISPGSISAQRTATALSGILMMIFLYAIISRLSRRKTQAFIAGAIFATSYAIIMMSRNATWDIYCHSFMLGAIYFFICALQNEKSTYVNFMLVALFWSLSFMSKGPVSFFALFLPFIISYFAIYRPSMRGKWKALGVAIIVTLILTGSWPLYVYIHEQDHLQYVADKESSAWTGHNVRPWYYYKLFFVEAGLWSLFWLTSLIYAFSKKDFKKDKSSRFYLLWTFAILILLSIVPEKKTRYLLPILIPGAMNISAYWNYIIQNKIRGTKDRWWYNANILILIIVFLAIPPLVYFMVYKKEWIDLCLFSVITLIFWSFASFLVYGLTRKEPYKASIFTTLILSMIVVTTVAFIPAKKIFINTDRHSIKELRNIESLNKYPFYYPEDEFLRMELVYEANKVIKPLNLSDSLTLNKQIPFVLVSTTPIADLLPSERFKITLIGRYDNNWRQTESKRYNTELVKEVNLIEFK